MALEIRSWRARSWHGSTPPYPVRVYGHLFANTDADAAGAIEVAMNGPKTRDECWRQDWVPIGRQFTCLTISQDMLSHCYRSSERCRSGRTGRSRKPLSLLRGTEGSNPSLSASKSGSGQNTAASDELGPPPADGVRLARPVCCINTWRSRGFAGTGSRRAHWRGR